jgi:uncharacterized protein (TIGR03435 family)
MKRLVVATAMVLAVVPAMGQENLPSFEVVFVKVNRSGVDRQDMRLLPGGRAVATNVPLRRVILTAYGLLTPQLIGGPDWFDSTRFDIVAHANENLTPSAPGGPPGRERLMLRRLLAERFKFSGHDETRELPIYELVMARTDGRLGPRMSPARVDCDALREAYSRGEGSMPPSSDCGGSREPGRVWMRGATMSNFARAILAGWTDRIVEDQTGLRGGYDFDLEFAPESGTTIGAPAADGNLPSLFTALEEQLGLKLRPGRKSVDVLVIDRLELPTEN